MICSFLFAALLFFICSVPLFYLQRSSFLFAAFLFIYLQRFPFLFAAFLFCLQRSFFVCSVSLLFAAFLFCLQRFFFICSVSFLFAAFLFCLQRVPCGPPYICEDDARLALRDMETSDSHLMSREQSRKPGVRSRHHCN